MTTRLDGKKIAQQILEELQQKAKKVEGKPTLSFIWLEGHFASDIYVNRKKAACDFIGFSSREIRLPASTSEKEIIHIIEKENNKPEVHGILVQQPLPNLFSTHRIVEAIDPAKDVDGFHPCNMGRTLLGDSSGFRPCTPLGIVTLLRKYFIETKGKHVVIIGRSNIVGKPLAAMLMQKNEGGNASVTLLHSYSQDISSFTRSADIIVTALGKSHFLRRDYVRAGSIVIDVGINRVSEKSTKMVGDVDFAEVAPLCSYITPVPGGVGPMTIAMLMSNTWLSYKRSIQ